MLEQSIPEILDESDDPEVLEVIYFKPDDVRFNTDGFFTLVRKKYIKTEDGRMLEGVDSVIYITRKSVVLLSHVLELKDEAALIDMLMKNNLAIQRRRDLRDRISVNTKYNPWLKEYPGYSKGLRKKEEATSK